MNRRRLATTRGIALLMGLVLLAAISLLAVAAANGMVLQRRMAANFEEDGRALQNAALAESSARAWLFSRADSEREPGCTEACVLPVAVHGPGDLPPDPEFESAAWWRLNGALAGFHPESGEPVGPAAGGAEPARWVIEEMRFQPLDTPHPDPSASAFGGIGYYRVLGRGTGNHPGSVAVTESIVARPWEGEYAHAMLPHMPGSDFCGQFDEAVDCGIRAWRQRR